MLFGKYVNKYYLRYWYTFLLGIIALLVVDYIQLNVPEILGSVLDGIKEKTLTRELLKDYMIKLLFIACGMFVGRFSWRLCIFGNAIKIETDIRREMFEHTELMSQEFFGNNKTGALMALYINDLNTVKQTFGSGTVMTIDAIALGSMAFVKMLKKNWKLSLLCVIPMLILALCGSIIGKRLRQKSLANHKVFAELSDFVQESFTGLFVIKAFVKEAKELRVFRSYNEQNFNTTMDALKAGTLFNILIDGVVNYIGLIIIGFGSMFVMHPEMLGVGKTFTAGNLITFISLFSSVTWPMMAIGQLINMVSQGKAAMGRIKELMDAEVEINDDNAIECNDEIKGNITYNHLTFSYPNSEMQELKDVNLEIKQGEMIGIMGKTGGGKTTLITTLLRLYNIDFDKIYIDGHDIMKMPIKKVRESISYVPQDNFLFSTSILENIGFYTDEISLEEVEKNASYADVDKDIQDFTNKYETILGERGVTVSGGQRQRISIARALIKDAPILILDDSVSAVDTKTEEIILSNLRKLRKNKTTIIIAHRISTLETLDKIIVINDGIVEDFGTHEELLEKNKYYKKQVKLQELEDEAGESHEQHIRQHQR